MTLLCSPAILFEDEFFCCTCSWHDHPEDNYSGINALKCFPKHQYNKDLEYQDYFFGIEEDC